MSTAISQFTFTRPDAEPGAPPGNDTVTVGTYSTTTLGAGATGTF